MGRSTSSWARGDQTSFLGYFDFSVIPSALVCQVISLISSFIIPGQPWFFLSWSWLRYIRHRLASAAEHVIPMLFPIHPDQGRRQLSRTRVQWFNAANTPVIGAHEGGTHDTANMWLYYWTNIISYRSVTLPDSLHTSHLYWFEKRPKI